MDCFRPAVFRGRVFFVIWFYTSAPLHIMIKQKKAARKSSRQPNFFIRHPHDCADAFSVQFAGQMPSDY